MNIIYLVKSEYLYKKNIINTVAYNIIYNVAILFPYCICKRVAILAFQSSHANMIRKTKIVKSKKHLEWVARNHVCLRCRSNYGIQSTHIRHTDSKGNIGWGIKPCDGMVVPLCYLCHQKQHSMNELKFWIALNINPIYVAKELAQKSVCVKIKQLAKEGYYNESIKYYDNLQASAKSTLESENL